MIDGEYIVNYKVWLVLVLVVVGLSLVVPGLVQGQIEPSPEGPVDYGPTITTNEEKLFAVYSLIGQAIDEYNRQSEIASGNVSKYVDKLRTYSETEFKAVINTLMDERNALMLAIRRGVYSDKAWSELDWTDQEVIDRVIVELWGNKTAEASKPTLATADRLDELKLVDLGALEPTPGVDPLEDYTTYDEYDEVSELSETATVITATSSHPRYRTFWYTDDKGANHFDGDFEHRYEWTTTYLTTYTLPTLWALINDPLTSSYDMRSLVLDGYEHTRNYLYCNPGRNFYLYQKADQGDAIADLYSGWTLSTHYYVTTARDDDYGTYGRTTTYLCTGNYYGESGSSLVDTLVIDLTAQDDYRYIVAVSSYDAGDGAGNLWTATMENLDLQEGAGPTAVPFSFGYILGG